jgi:lipopolysaccharide export system protein LptA
MENSFSMTKNLSNKIILMILLLAFSKILFFVTADAIAQSLDLATGKSEQPVEVTSDNGIEWQRGNQVMIATGNAKASRGTSHIEADTLRAYYKKNKKGGSGLSRLDAVGQVIITSPTQRITGETGVYDLEQAIIVVTGKKVTLISGKDKISATQQMEYYEKKEMAIARENASVLHDGKLLRANTLVAFFSKDKNSKSQVYRVQAFENVRLVTKTESIWANKGIYDVISGIVTLNGDVRISRDGNQLNGDHATINLNTGISKLLSAPVTASPKSSSRKKKRVRGYLVPKTK